MAHRIYNVYLVVLLLLIVGINVSGCETTEKSKPYINPKNDLAQDRHTSNNANYVEGIFKCADWEIDLFHSEKEIDGTAFPGWHSFYHPLGSLTFGAIPKKVDDEVIAKLLLDTRYYESTNNNAGKSPVNKPQIMAWGNCTNMIGVTLRTQHEQVPINFQAVKSKIKFVKMSDKK